MMGHVPPDKMFANGANGEGVDDDGTERTCNIIGLKLATPGRMMAASQMPFVPTSPYTTFHGLGSRRASGKITKWSCRWVIGIGLHSILHFILCLQLFPLLIRPNNIGRLIGNTYRQRLRAYFPRFLVLCCFIDMVVAVSEAPQQAITDPSRAPGNNKRRMIGGFIGGTVLLLTIFGVLVWYLFSRIRRLRKRVKLSNWQFEGGPTYTRFSYNQIVKATNNFDTTRVIGEGGFGKVYLGILDDGTTVAIKRGSRLHHQGEKEFRAEIQMLLKLRHYHLISLLGCCEEKLEMILVYEYMDNGTLRQHLYDVEPLTLIQRIKIAIDAAHGLHYLHTGFERPIIHRDVKSSNILLDKFFRAKVSDFGLSKELPLVDHSQLSGVKGSFGYLDPEYFRLQRFTEKSDVYSFGVVLFELICARPALDQSLPSEQVALAEWALNCYKYNTLDQIIDPYLKGKVSRQCLEMYVETAVGCLAGKGGDRPSMGKVVSNLERVLQLQQGVIVSHKMTSSSFDGTTGGKKFLRLNTI